MEKSRGKEFLETLCNIYMIFMMAVLPLYINGTYYLLGDTKYDLFRNVSVICLGIWLVLSVWGWLCDYVACRRISVHRKRERLWEEQAEKHGICKNISMVDICVFLYGIVNLAAGLCSSFESVAWNGYRDWHMGALSQLMFVGIYFLVSRHFTRNAVIVYLGEAAFFAVTVIGLFSRLGVDLLGVYREYSENAWEYSHMLSTIGNINWLCGYYSVALALPVAGYLYSVRKGKQIILYIVSLMGLTLLCIQGSDSGFLIATMGIGICMILSVKNPHRFRKVLFLMMGLTIMIPVMAELIALFEAQAATPIDGDIYAKMQWGGWWFLALLIGVVCIVQSRLQVSLQRRFDKGIVIFATVATGMMAVVLLLSWKNVPMENWGSGRGVLWQMAWDCFTEGDWKQRLIGAGPDCYAEYLMSRGITPTIDTEGHWSGAIYANAHNEWLTHLTNIGLFGVAAYFAIFASAWKRYKGMLLGVLLLGMYGIHSLVSFQQVLNTPLFFLVLGMCENQCRSVGMSVENSDGTIEKVEKYGTQDRNREFI